MSYYVNEAYLMHHGVKGMKWGVRHDRAPTGIRRRRGSNLTEAQKRERKRKLTRRILIGSAALSLAAVVALEKKKHTLMATDRILKAGTPIQNIAPAGRNFSTPFYAVSDKKDMQFYRKMFSSVTKGKNPGRDVATILTNEKDVAVAGKKQMDAAYKRAYGQKGLKNIIRRETFYRKLGALKPEQKEAFNRELMKKGYGAHKDINDMQFIFGGDTPMVFFGKHSGYKPTSSEKINVKMARKIKVLTGVGKRSLYETAAFGAGASSVYALGKKDVLKKAAPSEKKRAKKNNAKGSQQMKKNRQFLMHYNHNHDPSNGQFARSPGHRVEAAFEPGKNGKPSPAERIGRAGVEGIDNTKRLVGKRRRGGQTKSYPHMSDAELQRRINRLQMEKRYSELTDPGLSRGRQRALDVLDITGDVMAIGVSAAVIGAQLYKIRK